MRLKLAFVVWNSFQILHFKSLLNIFPNALLVIEVRKRSKHIDKIILKDILNNVVYIPQHRMHEKLDGKFDIIVIQTVFEQLYLFKKSKIAMLQYGYAKEAYNYGSWRSLSDLNIVYGSYAYDKLSAFSPTAITGCPRYDDFFSQKYQKQALESNIKYLCLNKKTILYAPTWGELSSFDLYFKDIEKLSDKYNVLVKLHHNSILLSDKQVDYSNTTVRFFYEDTDLLSLIAISDIVISDFSGAIFDSIYCKKIVVLLSIPTLLSNKIDDFSLEISQRSKLGYQVDSPDKLSAIIDKALNENKLVDEDLYNRLYFNTTNATDNVKKELYLLAEGKYKLSQSQMYIRQTVRDLYTERNRQKKLKNKRLIKFKSIFIKLLKSKNKFI